MICLLKIVTSHGYLKLPEGKQTVKGWDGDGTQYPIAFGQVIPQVHAKFTLWYFKVTMENHHVVIGKTHTNSMAIFI